MTERQQLLKSIADTTADYRVDQPIARGPEHVDKWVKQFDEDVQLPILREMNHVLSKTYFPKPSIEEFLGAVLKSNKLAGDDPCPFWKNVTFLKIQRGGASQDDMLDLLDQQLKKICGLGMADCGKNSETYVYLDDVLCTGSRILDDVKRWVKDKAPERAKLLIVTMAYHTGGQYYADQEIKKVARESGKDVTISWCKGAQIETFVDSRDESDVLWPTHIPDESDVINYVESMHYKPKFRNSGHVGLLGIFSGEEGRNILEQQFLIAGAKIRQQSKGLPDTARPLGYMRLETLGLGTLVVTYRNCPNNAPLALWAGRPWLDGPH